MLGVKRRAWYADPAALACEAQLSPQFSGTHRRQAAVARPLNPSCPFRKGYLKRGPQHLLTLLPVAAGGRPQAATPGPDGTRDRPLLLLGASCPSLGPLSPAEEPVRRPGLQGTLGSWATAAPLRPWPAS